MTQENAIQTNAAPIWAEVAGWYGMVALIVAYALASFNAVDAQGLAYQLLNLTGGIGLVLIAWKKHVYQSVLLNLFWAAIGVVAISNIIV